MVDSDKPAAVPPIGEPTEPMSYKVDSVSMGVASDNYSYLDQSPGDLSAMGIGGMRQPHHYESIVSDGVSIPADTNGDMSDDKLIQKHQNEINIGYKPSSNKYYWRYVNGKKDMSMDNLIQQHLTEINTGYKPVF